MAYIALPFLSLRDDFVAAAAVVVVVVAHERMSRCSDRHLEAAAVSIGASSQETS